MGLLTRLTAPVAPAGNTRSGINPLRWRTQFGFGPVEWVVLLLFATVAALTLPLHEPWSDEAQAWLVARDNSFWQIFRYRLHYEGTPPLWPFFLHLLRLLHVPWPAVGSVGASIAIAGIAVFLRFAPFPLLWRVLLPFTFFVQYQYTVIARSYVVFPLLLFALCAIYVARPLRPLLFAVIAGLLANLCMQGAVLSCILTLLYAFENRRALRGLTGSSLQRVRGAIAVLIVLWFTAIYAAIPAPDVNFAIGDQISGAVVHGMLDFLIGESPRTVTLNSADLRYLAAAAKDVPVGPEPDRAHHFAGWLGWQLRASPEHRSLGETSASILYVLIELASEALWPVAISSLLGCLFYAALAWWAWRQRGLRYFLPSFALLMVGEFVWTADHHSGMLLLSLFAGMWLAYCARHRAAEEPDVRLQTRTGLAHTFAPAFVLFVAFLFVLQIGWTVHAVRSDRQTSYDPSEETARFLLAQPPGTRMASFHFWAVGIQPYFPRNPFFNQLSSWYQWSSNVNTDSSHHRDLGTRPAFVVYTREWPLPDSMRNQFVPINVDTGGITDPVILDIFAHGYRTTHVFCGNRFARLSAAYRVCDYVLEPLGSPVSASAQPVASPSQAPL